MIGVSFVSCHGLMNMLLLLKQLRLLLVGVGIGGQVIMVIGVDRRVARHHQLTGLFGQQHGTTNLMV